MAKKSIAKKQQRIFRSKEEIQRLLSEISVAQAKGFPLMATLKKLNIPYNTHNQWTKRFGKTVPATSAAASVGKKAVKGKVTAPKKSPRKRRRFSAEQKDAMRERDKALKAGGNTDKEVAKILGIAVPTLYKMRKDVKAAAPKPRGRAAAKSQIQLSADNPMYQLAVAHERLMAVKKQLDALTTERDVLAGKMRVLMKKAAEVCPGLNSEKIPCIVSGRATNSLTGNPMPQGTKVWFYPTFSNADPTTTLTPNSTGNYSLTADSNIYSAIASCALYETSGRQLTVSANMSGINFYLKPQSQQRPSVVFLNPVTGSTSAAQIGVTAIVYSRNGMANLTSATLKFNGASYDIISSLTPEGFYRNLYSLNMGANTFQLIATNDKGTTTGPVITVTRT